MRIDTRVVGDLGGYFNAVNEIAKSTGNDPYHPPVLWFRGISNFQYSLLPSLFRSKTRVRRSGSFKTDYSSMHYAEDIRTQHYIAKNSHFFQSEPASRVEWLEVMQHHGVGTRVLDWSESSIHSLLFAIEMFLDNSKYHEQEREDALPCVWVLEPAKLNREIFDYLKTPSFEPEIQKLLGEMAYTKTEKAQVLEKIKQLSCFEIYDETKETKHMDYILNLSVINDEVLRDRSRIKNMLLEGDVVNPYYYLLSRIYSDGHILSNRALPPLAVVHPYHSERIKAQRGVFTVFPFYEEQDKDKDEHYRGLGVNPDAMDHNDIASKMLHQIVIGNPRKVAYELMQNGTNDSWLYPELPVISSEIENRVIY